MRSAIYYPHTEVRNTDIMKSSLLLWDRVEFIVPFSKYSFTYTNRELAQAVEMIGVGRVPSDAVKREAHDLIEDFATSALPEGFFYADRGNDEYIRHGMWAEKLLPETWELLRRLQIVGQRLPNRDYPLQDAAGLSLMSILADCCAGETKCRITDRGAAYAALTNMMVNKKEKMRHTDNIVPLTLRLIDESKISLGQLIDFRKKEAASAGHSYRDLRHRYVDRLKAHIGALQNITRMSDVEELNSNFERDMSDDLLSLCEALKTNRRNLLLSKEVIFTGVAAAGSALAALHVGSLDVPSAINFAGGIVTVGGFAASVSKFAESRLETLRKHPMAYLYEIRQRR